MNNAGFIQMQWGQFLAHFCFCSRVHIIHLSNKNSAKPGHLHWGRGGLLLRSDRSLEPSPRSPFAYGNGKNMTGASTLWGWFRLHFIGPCGEGDRSGRITIYIPKEVSSGTLVRMASRKRRSTSFQLTKLHHART